MDLFYDLLFKETKNTLGNYSVRIIEATGWILSVKKPAANHQLIDVQDLATGFFFIRIDETGWTVNAKMVIEK